MFPEVSGRAEKKQLYRLISIGAEYDLRDIVVENPALIGSAEKFGCRPIRRPAAI